MQGYISPSALHTSSVGNECFGNTYQIIPSTSRFNANIFFSCAAKLETALLQGLVLETYSKFRPEAIQNWCRRSTLISKHFDEAERKMNAILDSPPLRWDRGILTSAT